jgi:hypothetical protein
MLILATLGVSSCGISPSFQKKGRNNILIIAAGVLKVSAMTLLPVEIVSSNYLR